MKNKHFLFSISLAISVSVIMLLSVFVDSTVFDGIAQAITIPFLLFTVASCAFSIVEEIISSCKTKCTIANEIHERWNYYKNTLETQLGWVQRYDNPQNKDQIETNELIDEKQKQLADANRTLDDCALDYLVYNEIIEKCEKNVALKVLYVVSLTVLIVSMMISPILAPYCSFVPTTTLTLLSLFFAIMEVLVKEKVASSIFLRMYNKRKKQYQEKIDARKQQ